MSRDWAELATTSIEKADVIIKATPFDGAASVGKGACQAPDRLRQLSRVLPAVTEEGIVLKDFHVKDEGDYEVDLNWERFYQHIEEDAGKLFQTGKFCFFLGGDHSTTIPLEVAFLNHYSGKRVGVIHFDSHSDILDEYEGHKWSHACTQRRALENENLKDEGLTLVGIRSWETEEITFLAEHKDIKVIKAAQVYEKGIGYVMEQLKERYQSYDAVYLSIDIDVLDPAFAPGTGTPECGGLSTRELMQMVKFMIAQLPIKAMDIVEVSPPLDASDITSWAALKVMYEVFGQLYLRKQS
jgi:agmatinase